MTQIEKVTQENMGSLEKSTYPFKINDVGKMHAQSKETYGSVRGSKFKTKVNVWKRWHVRGGALTSSWCAAWNC